MNAPPRSRPPGIPSPLHLNPYPPILPLKTGSRGIPGSKRNPGGGTPHPPSTSFVSHPPLPVSQDAARVAERDARRHGDDGRAAEGRPGGRRVRLSPSARERRGRGGGIPSCVPSPRRKIHADSPDLVRARMGRFALAKGTRKEGYHHILDESSDRAPAVPLGLGTRSSTSTAWNAGWTSPRRPSPWCPPPTTPAPGAGPRTRTVASFEPKQGTSPSIWMLRLENRRSPHPTGLGHRGNDCSVPPPRGGVPAGPFHSNTPPSPQVVIHSGWGGGLAQAQVTPPRSPRSTGPVPPRPGRDPGGHPRRHAGRPPLRHRRVRQHRCHPPTRESCGPDRWVHRVHNA